MNNLHDKYKGRVEFLLVYVREAHAIDGWQVKENERDGVLLPAAKSFEQKQEHATACSRKLDIKFAAAVDGMDNQTESNYTAWPDRLYLVARDGRVAWKSGPGPGGFKPGELDAAIRKELSLP